MRGPFDKLRANGVLRLNLLRATQASPGFPVLFKGGFIAMVIKVFGIIAFLIVFASCSSGTSNTPTPLPSTAATYAVQIDGESPTYNAGFIAYFPNELTVHPGDTVQFKLVDRGEPHSVTFGSLIEQGLAAADKANQAEPGSGDRVPEMVSIPDIIPGPGDAVQAAAQPCYLATGGPPAQDACAKAQQTQPSLTGKQSFYNSGWLATDQTFTVKLADDIAPGTYRYMCLLHRSEMSGKVTVVAKSATADTPAQAKQKGDQQLAKLVQDLKPAADQLASLTPANAQAGNLSEKVLNGQVNQFGPKPINIKVGESVTWTILGPHTISFNATQDANGVRGPTAPDGSLHLNIAAVSPAGGPGQPEPPANAPPPPANAAPGPPIIVDAGSWDGTGFRSSGLFVSFPPQLFAYKLTFTKAGTYKYQCLIHDKMEAAVNVQ